MRLLSTNLPHLTTLENREWLPPDWGASSLGSGDSLRSLASSRLSTFTNSTTSTAGSDRGDLIFPISIPTSPSLTTQSSPRLIPRPPPPTMPAWPSRTRPPAWSLSSDPPFNLSSDQSSNPLNVHPSFSPPQSGDGKPYGESNSRESSNRFVMPLENVREEPLASSNPFVNGSRVWDPASDGPLCLRCGELVHYSGNGCNGASMEYWEQAYLTRLLATQRSAHDMLGRVQNIDYHIRTVDPPPSRRAVDHQRRAVDHQRRTAGVHPKPRPAASQLWP